MVYHQYHEPRPADRWRDNPGVKRFLRGGPARCRYGVDKPWPQDPVEVLRLRPRCVAAVRTVAT